LLLSKKFVLAKIANRSNRISNISNLYQGPIRTRGHLQKLPIDYRQARNSIINALSRFLLCSFTRLLIIKTQFMKKLILSIFVLAGMNAFGQASKWFVSLTPSSAFGGPFASINNQMKKQGWGEASSFNFLGLTGTINYPVGEKNPGVLLRIGKRISDFKTVYMVAGISNSGYVGGFKNEGYTDLLGIFGGSIGDWATIHYKVLQFTGGYLYSFPKTRAQLGFGPSVFILNYNVTQTGRSGGETHASFVPGATFTARLPLGKEKRLFGIDLIVEGSLAPPAKMKVDDKSITAFDPGKVNMIHGTAGLAFCLRQK
jgi:hypothetical protein